MNDFIARYQNEIAGVLSGFDRVLFRGTLRSLYALPGQVHGEQAGFVQGLR